MAWYTTGTIAVSGTTVTGTGTNFLDNTQSIGPGQALLIPGSGTVKMYEVASVQSATNLTLKTSAGTVAAGQAYAILSFYTDSVPDFARRLAAQLSYYQSQMDGWQQIMTGTGSVTLTAPDGTSVTISSFSKLTTDIANALKLPTANSSGDIGAIITAGIYSIPSSMTGLPISSNGVLLVTTIASGASVVQDFTCVSSSASNLGRVYRRVGSIASGVTTWTDWFSQNLWHIEASGVDLNTYIRPGTYAGGSFVNGPAAMGTAVGFMTVLANVSATNITQQITYVASGRTWTRTCSGGTWTAWVESLTTNSNPGVTDASNAAVGQVGEYREATSVPLTMTSGTNRTMTSLTLPAGDWDVDGVYQATSTNATVTDFLCGLSTTDAGNDGFPYVTQWNSTSNPNRGPVPTRRLSVSSATTIYLVGRVIFASGSVSGMGFIRARRVR